MENEGKGANDALGLAVVAPLKYAVAAGEKIRNYSNAARIVHRRTQGNPVCGKYSVYTQYVFMAVHPGNIKNVPTTSTTSPFVDVELWPATISMPSAEFLDIDGKLWSAKPCTTIRRIRIGCNRRRRWLGSTHLVK